MAIKVKIKLNKAGVRQLLLSKEIEAICSEEAAQIKNRCGEGYKMDKYKGKNRVNASVIAESFKAKKDNYENNTLLKAVTK